jgi:hypothetical protein
MVFLLAHFFNTGFNICPKLYMSSNEQYRGAGAKRTTLGSRQSVITPFSLDSQTSFDLAHEVKRIIGIPLVWIRWQLFQNYLQSPC